MSILHGAVNVLLRFYSPSHILFVIGAGLGTMVVIWTANLLMRHAWYSHKLSCFSKPPTHSWLIGHLGQVGSVLIVFHLAKLFVLSSLNFTDLSVPGESLLISNGDVWSRKRRLLTPAFHFDILKNYIVIFNSSTNSMHEKWKRMILNGKNNIEMFNDVTLMTLDSLLKCAFSCNSNCQERLKMLHHWDWLYWKTEQGKRFKKALSIVHGYTRDVVQKRRALISQQTKSEISMTAQRRKDFVDIILSAKDEDGQGLSDEEILAEANTFMFAGHDTTASAICWTLYNLAQHSHYQEKCREEVKELLKERNGQEIECLPFTTMCIKESLRLHSPVQACNIISPFFVTLGVICLVSIYGTHHNPIVWSNPHEFDPMRFDPNNREAQSSSAFIPFSAGPRYCSLVTH
uniref:aromatase n=1 Tax=Periophthalmus magnuspinnatus TaxID=409849 RepID=A0A3B3Z9F1_9GOBI